ncbi:FecR family protein [Achromobacter denitrificans]|uniref:FecR family protein n=1 Tax=Achromobacter denitrificans TaxID=32002 RepID=UPI003D06F627
MNQDRHSPPPAQDAADDIDDVALRWFMTLREAGADTHAGAAARAKLDEWLSRDPRHRRAFEACERDWLSLQPLAERYAPAAPPPRRAPRRPRFALAMAAVVMAVGGYLAWQTQQYADFSLWGPRSFETAHAGSEALAMSDGTHVVMDVGTELNVAYSGQQRRVALATGAAYFDVARDPARPFVVEVGSGSVQVLGTAFEVQRLPDGLRVNVARGHVRVLPADGAPPVELFPGQSVRLEPGRVTPVRPISDSQVAAWRQNRLVFENETLEEVGRALSRRGVWSVQVDPSVRNLPVTLIVQLGDVVNALQALPDIAPVAVTRAGRVLTIAPSGKPDRIEPPRRLGR